ncbi:glycosyl transferase, partial [Streptomyces sp. SR27]|nr:glycosyl transferase [Streptomyces sp. SR27]
SGGGRMFEGGGMMPPGFQGGRMPGGRIPGGQGGQMPGGQGQGRGMPAGTPPGGAVPEAFGPGGNQRPGAGGMGGLLNGASVGAQAKAALLADAGDYTWVAATVGAQNAASYQLATEKPVMAIGGFNGSDPSPTLAQFKRYVAEGRIHYFIGGGEGGGGETGGRTGGGGPGGGNSEISTWVAETFQKVTVGGATFYDLTREK